MGKEGKRLEKGNHRGFSFLFMHVCSASHLKSGDLGEGREP
jgi:hypothetical protein